MKRKLRVWNALGERLLAIDEQVHDEIRHELAAKIQELEQKARRAEVRRPARRRA